MVVFTSTSDSDMDLVLVLPQSFARCASSIREVTCRAQDSHIGSLFVFFASLPFPFFLLLHPYYTGNRLFRRHTQLFLPLADALRCA